ncbi:MAG TPA: class I SAM-dependent methyltransferase [Ktedonobacteraceae bacterium]|nr:class I SAM-dependent methyltransferase [Ktedonobacteraceae bacterium]
MPTNAYSALWFKLFMPLQNEEWTQNDAAFIARQLPLPRYRRVLDLACGQGRHALALAKRGYQVTGLDRDEAAIAEARQRARAGRQNIEYIVGDMLQLDNLPGTFDGIISMWQSFCYFDEATNMGLLRSIFHRLAPGGRFIVDMYNRAYFENHQGYTEQSIEGVTVKSHGYLQGKRWHSELSYSNGHEELGDDHMDWQIFTPQEFCALATICDFIPLLVCTWSNESLSPSPDVARMQIVLEKPGLE